MGSTLPLKIVDPTGFTLFAELDEWGRSVREWDGDYSSTDPLSRSEFITDSLNQENMIKSYGRLSGGGEVQVAEKEVDGLGRELKECALGKENGGMFCKSYAYDNEGKRTGESLPYSYSSSPNSWSTFQYDSLGRVENIDYADGSAESYIYNLTENTVIKPGGYEKTIIKNALGQVVKVIEPDSKFLTYEYDTAGNLTKAKNHDGFTLFSAVFNSLGQRISLATPDRGTTLYNYDSKGRLFTQTDGLGSTITNYYDQYDRKTKITYKLQSSVAPVRTIYYYYDNYPSSVAPNIINYLSGLISGSYSISEIWNIINSTYVQYAKGKLTYINDGITQTQYFYDERGRVVKEVRFIDGEEYIFQNIFDGAYLVKTINPDGDEVETAKYTNSGLPKEVLFNGNSLVEFSRYDKFGNIETIDYGNNTTTEHDYDKESGRLLQISTTNRDGDLLQDLNYKYNESRQIKKISDGVTRNVDTYTYDELNRLSSSERSGNTSEILNYTFDTLGNLKTKENLTFTYYPGTHRVFEAFNNEGGFREYKFTYDSIGNTTRKIKYGANGERINDYHFTYNEFNKLHQAFVVTAVDSNENILSESLSKTYLYDFSSALVLIIEGSNLSSPESKRTIVGYGYERLEYNGVDKHIIHISGGNKRIATITRIISGASASFGGHFLILLAMLSFLFTSLKYKSLRPNFSKGSILPLFLVIATFLNICPMARAETPIETILYYHNNHQGSTHIVTNSNGNTVGNYTYKPYGEIRENELIEADDESLVHTYTGQRRDNETGLMYYGARFYDPIIGRFTQADTIVPDAVDSQGWNPYSYVRNDPINHVDPTGHSYASTIISTIVGAIVGILVTVITRNPVLGGLVGGFVGGFLNGAMNGNIQQAFMGGLMGAVMGAISAGVGQALSSAGLGVLNYVIQAVSTGIGIISNIATRNYEGLVGTLVGVSVSMVFSLVQAANSYEKNAFFESDEDLGRLANKMHLEDLELGKTNYLSSSEAGDEFSYAYDGISI